MSVKAFATEHAGKRCKLLNEHINLTNNRYCKVIGYYTRYKYVIVELEDNTNVANTFSLSDQGEHVKMVVAKYGNRAYRVELSGLQVCGNQKAFQLYPGICKTCKSPARKCGRKVMCSNSRCSTGRKTVQAILGKRYIVGTFENPIQVVCGCNRIANMLYGAKHTANCVNCGSFRQQYERNKWYSFYRTKSTDKTLAGVRVIKYLGGPKIFWTDKNVVKIKTNLVVDSKPIMPHVEVSEI